MNVVKLIVAVITANVISVHSAEVITGRLVNNSSKGLDSARVWLKSNPLVVDSSDSDGKFSLPLASTSVRRNCVFSGAPQFSIKNGQPVISLSKPQKVSVRLFNVKGELAAVASEGMLSAGKHNLPLKRCMASLTPGNYILSCASEELSFECKVLYTNKISFSDTYTSVVQGNHISTGAATGGDTLVILRMGYEIKKIAMPQVTAKDVGQVQLSLRTYKVAATTAVKSRTIEVVLPSDYNELYKLPVLYLLHGGGEDHTAWRTKGQLIDALNGLQFPERDKMQAMIIVTPDAASNSGYGNYGKNGDAFYTDLTVDIRKHVESTYKVDTSRNARAISGFSMGAMQTHNLTLFYPALFGYAFPICGGLYKCSGFTEAKMKSDIANGTIDTSLVHSMKAYRLHSNETDIAWTDTRDFEKFLTTVSVKHSYDFTSYSIGGHTFSYCNAVFKKYSAMLFKN